MFEKWECPEWGEPWEPQVELNWARRICTQVHKANHDLCFRLDTETEGCLFVELIRDGMLIGVFTISVLLPEAPLVSMFMGSEGDEFDITNLKVIPAIPKFYTTEYVYPEDEDENEDTPAKGGNTRGESCS